MQRNQIITNVRTIGLVVGALLFVFLVFRSGQSATNEAAVKGKPFLWHNSGQLNAAGTYAASTTSDIALASAASQTAAPTRTNNAPSPTTNSTKPKPTRADQSDVPAAAQQPISAANNTSESYQKTDIHQSK